MSSSDPLLAETTVLAGPPPGQSSDEALTARRSNRPGSFRRLLGSELRLVFRRRRNLALLIVLAGPPLLIGLAVHASSPRDGGGPAFLGQITGNGLFLVYTALTVCLPLFLPLAVGVVAGDSIAGEAGSGTLRYLLTIPVGRARLLLAKALSVMIFAAASVCVVAVSGLVTGAVLFGLHDLTLLSGDTVSLANGMLRTVGVAAYVIVALTGIVALGMFISTLTEVPIAAMAATIAITIIAEVLDAVPQLGSFRSILFTHNWLGYGDLLRPGVSISTLVGNSMLQVAYVAIFGALAWARFTTKDVTS
jgi:ABC-2 type transport system permease protein